MSRQMGDAWVDRSPHQSGFVTLNGIKLHYLDWGGQGEILLFLHGNGHTAHIFDDLAPRFVDGFRVLALTRRGHGESDRPDTGYDTNTLVEDVRQFLDQKGIRRAILAGHSFAGDELTRFAGLYPERVSSLIYLDAAYDSSGLPAILANHPVSFAPSDSDLRSFDTLRHYLQTLRSFGTGDGSWSPAEEATMRASWTTGADGTVHYLLPGPVLDALWKGMIEARPDYTQVRAPALSFYVIWDQPPWLSFCADEATRDQALCFYEQYNRWKKEQIERFREEVVNGRVVEMPSTDHQLFLHRPDEVVQAMRSFLLGT